jgi:oligopeptide transport system ATP-binding protein
MPLLEVDELTVRFDTPDGVVTAVDRLSFELEPGQMLGIVGESGSGKTQTALSLMGLLAGNGRVTGNAFYGERDLLTLDRAALDDVRGHEIAIIFQDPMTSLNPYLSIAKQMTEVLVRHQDLSLGEARRVAIRMLDRVQIPDAASRIDSFPHEFSGGMRQRVMIAMALLCGPRLLIADEPTTALDVTVQDQILRLLDEIRAELDMGVILITHDLGVVAGLCDRVLVMYGGRVMEYGTLDDIFYEPRHPYTLGLLGSVPNPEEAGHGRLPTIPGNPPTMGRPARGCPFAARCEHRLPQCDDDRPTLRPLDDIRLLACHLDESP